MYKAKDAKNRTYAVKKMIVQSFESEVASRKEVECLRRYRHHSIIELVDSVVIESSKDLGKVYYLLFPYMQNGRYCLTNRPKTNS